MKETINTSKYVFVSKYFLREFTQLTQRHMENLEELLNRLNVTFKAFFLDEYEAKKAMYQQQMPTSENT
jgi:hypothetical protein